MCDDSWPAKKLEYRCGGIFSTVKPVRGPPRHRLAPALRLARIRLPWRQRRLLSRDRQRRNPDTKTPRRCCRGVWLQVSSRGHRSAIGRAPRLAAWHAYAPGRCHVRPDAHRGATVAVPPAKADFRGGRRRPPNLRTRTPNVARSGSCDAGRRRRHGAPAPCAVALGQPRRPRSTTVHRPPPSSPTHVLRSRPPLSIHQRKIL